MKTQTKHIAKPLKVMKAQTLKEKAIAEIQSALKNVAKGHFLF